MALRNYKPTSPSRRNLVLIDRSDLWKGKPEKGPFQVYPSKDLNDQ